MSWQVRGGQVRHWVPLLIMAMSLAVYWPLLSFYFTAVDTFPLLLTSKISSWSDLFNLFHLPHLSGRQLNATFYRPLVALSIALNRLFSGENPWGYHLSDILVHGLNATLLFRFLYLAQGRLPKPSLGFPLLAALLFLIHPLHLEVLPAIDRRADVLCTFFLLLSLTSLQKHINSPSRGALAISLVSALLSMLSKETGILTPFLAVTWLLFQWPHANRRRNLTIGAYALTVLAYLGLRAWALGPGLGYHLGYGYHEGHLPPLVVLADGIRMTGLMLIAPFLNAQAQTAEFSIPWLPALLLLGLCTWGIHLLRRTAPAWNWKSAFSMTLLIPLSQLALLIAAGRLSVARYFYVNTLAFAVIISGLIFLTWSGPRRLLARLISAALLLSLLAGVYPFNSLLGLPDRLSAWRKSSETLRQALPPAAPQLETLAEGTSLFVINAPYCIGAGCKAAQIPLLMEHSIQAWLDLLYPQKHFDAIVVNYLRLSPDPLVPFKTRIRFDAAAERLDVSTTGAQSLEMPWEPSNLTNHTHHGMKHDALFTRTPGDSWQFTPRSLPRPALFLVFVYDRFQVMPFENWSLHKVYSE